MAAMLLPFVSLLLLTFGFSLADHHEHCPAWKDWKPWTDCLWYPTQNMYTKIAHACGLHADRNLTGVLGIPGEEKPPPMCGHCSFKFRCRRRDNVKDCYPLDGQVDVCHDHGQICSLPKLPHLGCGYAFINEKLKQCFTRPDTPSYVRLGYRKMFESIPKKHCIEKDGMCKCCCGDYEPNEAGTECVKPPAHDCPAFGPPSEWSECLWFPMKDLVKHVEDHCHVHPDADGYRPPVATPPGIHIPEKCGYCSFRVKCMKRDKKDGCLWVLNNHLFTFWLSQLFYSELRLGKKSCGHDDCPTCGDICTMDKINGSCSFPRVLQERLWDDFVAKSKEKHMPHWKRDGYAKVLMQLPYSSCKEVGDKCKCCCHPYHPNEDGTACVVKDYCKRVHELHHHDHHHHHGEGHHSSSSSEDKDHHKDHHHKEHHH
ncbi:hypothetical protein D918_08154 [Trichuris suis]|uniref:Uncharacterized protein n=1 Tax=Trichuris suis TaxID=68888 RepID=A0A085LVK4_9BILA|nr:hypothetical protein M513_10152 [Trichuris suis]KHJ41782.1 hypothetical protein D918_08154 [Trichuris suis]